MEHELWVMSFNVRTDTSYDKELQWQYRRDVVAWVIDGIDIAGLQEVQFNQLADLRSCLGNYHYIGVGRDDGREAGEFCPIFYRKDRFTVRHSGHFWLSATPDTPGSKGWDGGCVRIATWGVFNDHSNQRDVLFLNTHLDHAGAEAQREGGLLLAERLGALSAQFSSLPVIVSGDFNLEPDSPVIRRLLNPTNPLPLLDTRESASRKENVGGTYHNFGALATSERLLIDYIFVSQNIQTLEYRMLSDKYNGVIYSDHAAITACVLLNIPISRKSA
ncbi:MAG: endonuclease/exonuclease/phosphatase family protein [Treponema sp.]|jgi:endonuclease/exonuclease/phosphatase family metal-dependent hydrolase|nr:endonuclease/exonuclease/phosphatase family protein [Treponema sp.]